jgi:hypothetical protein
MNNHNENTDSTELEIVVPLDPTAPPSINEEREKYKKEQQERIAKYVVGGRDLGGNLIIKTYSRGDEYVIYEIADVPPHESMLVYIDSIIEEDESMIDRYHAAKENFDEFISHCYKYNCSSIYKKRAATVLSAIILDKNKDDKNHFQKINEDIVKDYENTTKGRNLYQLGAVSLSLTFITLATIIYLLRDWSFMSENHYISVVIYAAAFASMGGFISVSLKIKTLHTDRELNDRIYFLYGSERILFSIIAGILVYFMLKGNLIFGFLNNTSDISFSTYIICALSGFSETLIPNTLRNLETKSEPKN